MQTGLKEVFIERSTSSASTFFKISKIYLALNATLRASPSVEQGRTSLPVLHY